MLTINVLEGTAFRDGREVRLCNGEFAVLAAMALQRKSRSREEWCDALWPDRDADAATRLLKVYVHRIRSKFQTSEVIDTDGSGYRLGRTVVVDVAVLEGVIRATTAGERVAAENVEPMQRAFDAITGRRYWRLADLEAYDDYERRFLALAIELARLLIDEAFRRDDGPHALTVAGELVELDPCDDVATEVLLRAQIRLGRRDAASRSFRAFCRTLRDELDLPPPEHLACLVQASAHPA